MILHVLDKLFISDGEVALEQIYHEVITGFASCHEHIAVEFNILVELDDVTINTSNIPVQAG